MAQKRGSLTFVELHVEKFVLGVAGLFTVAIIVYFMMGPNTIEFGNERLGPDQLDEAIARRADNLQRAVNNAQPKVAPVPDYARQLLDNFSKPLFETATANDAPPIPEELRVATYFGRPVPTLEIDKPPRDIALVTPLRPTPPVASTGMSLVQRRPIKLGPDESKLPDGPADEPIETTWVSVAAWFPRQAQVNDMAAAGYEGYRAKVHIVGVDVQRQELTASGEWADWQDVDPSTAMPQANLPAPVIDERSGEVLNQAELERTLDLVRGAERLLMEPPFYQVVSGDEWKLPPLPGYEVTPVVAPAPAPAPGPAPAPAPTPGEPPPGGPGGDPGDLRAARQDLRDAQEAFRSKDLATAETKARAVLNNAAAPQTLKNQAQRLLDDIQRQRTQEQQTTPTGAPARGASSERLPLIEHPTTKDPAVWFHDESVTPGKTYRYRMRVRLWNRYVGKQAMLHDPARAGDTVLVGEWSLPGEPITVAPRTHFFVKGPRFGEDTPTASVDVFTWSGGKWLVETFDVKIGDAIGEPAEVRLADADGNTQRTEVDFSTGALVLDLRVDETVSVRRLTGKGDFTYSDTKALVLVYLDPADNQVKERIDRTDRSDPVYKRLKGEASK